MPANSYQIGADPEFAILDQGHILVALLPQGKLGTDHGGRVVELRPDPSLLASRICADIYRTLNRRELVPYRQYTWKAGGMAAGQPIGGHIHFDIPYDQQHQPQNEVIRACDRMAQWFETLELFPRGECEARRREGAFGHYGNVRPAGRRADGHNRLEYRTPPSWLWSPDSAHLALTAFKLAVVDPTNTLAALHDPDVRPVAKLRSFLSGFASDEDASELTPRLARRGALDKFRGDPSADLKAAWGIPAQPNEAEPATVEAGARIGVNGNPSDTAHARLIEYYDLRIIEQLQNSFTRR